MCSVPGAVYAWIDVSIEEVEGRVGEVVACVYMHVAEYGRGEGEGRMNGWIGNELGEKGLGND